MARTYPLRAEAAALDQSHLATRTCQTAGEEKVSCETRRTGLPRTRHHEGGTSSAPCTRTRSTPKDELELEYVERVDLHRQDPRQGSAGQSDDRHLIDSVSVHQQRGLERPPWRPRMTEVASLSGTSSRMPLKNIACSLCAPATNRRFLTDCDRSASRECP